MRQEASRRISFSGAFLMMLCLAFGLLASEKAVGCQYNVRDLGFVDTHPNPYHCFLFLGPETPKERITAFRQTTFATFLGSNIQPELVDLRRDADHPSLKYLRFWEIQDLPAAVLVSPSGHSAVISLTTEHDSIWSSLQSVVTSPAREEILSRIANSHSIVLVVEGQDAAANRRAQRAVREAVERIGRQMTQLPKRIENPPYLLTVLRTERLSEELSLWSLGLDSEDTEVQVAVVFGRGRRFGPVLVGSEITSARLTNILSIIGLSCECGLDRRWSEGPRLPLRWSEKTESDVIRHLGFDPESPVVKMEVSGILGRQSSPFSDADFDWDLSGEELDRYTENVLKGTRSPRGARVSPAQYQALLSRQQPASHFTNPLILLLAGLVAINLGIGVIIWSRGKRKQPK
jgi:hypothetical protein